MASNIPDSAITDSDAFKALQQFSATIGSNPELVQGAGGNTSLKHEGILWIKASGTWLQNAMQAEQFVPVAIDPLLRAVETNDPSAEKALDFVLDEHNPSGLRPSIETTVHALLPQKVVVHVHCVDTLALAVREDAQLQFDRLLSNFNWSWIPYVRPGLPLAHMINQCKSEQCNVLVLGNHGLVVAADTVSEAADLLERVTAAVRCVPRLPFNAAIGDLELFAHGSSYQLPQNDRAHDVACDPVATRVAEGGSLYPDHVIFLGKGSVTARPGETLADIVQRQRDGNGAEPVSILIPGKGVLMKADASPGQQALAACLSDVCLRIAEGTHIHYLDDEENHVLLNWEAEHYRQQLEQAGH